MTTKSIWPEVPFGEIAEFRNGLNFTKENFGKGIKVIGVSDFQDYSIPKYDELAEINPEGVVRNEDFLKEGDILFVRSNGNRNLIGRSLFLKGVRGSISHSAFTIRARITSEKADPRFCAYLFRSSLVRKTLSAQGSGTNINNLNQRILNDIRVPLPQLPTQQKIAAILSTYDDLIENNTRRIKILEEMAQAIYREWFVNFRFPGHEGVRMVESELGPVPEEWDVCSLKDEIEPVRGLSYNGAGLSDSGMPLHNLNSVLDGGGYKFAGIKYYTGDFKEKHKIQPGEIIVTNTEQGFEYRLIGFPAIVPRCFGEECIFSHHIYRVRPRADSYLQRSFIYYLLMTDVVRHQIIAFANGTTVNMLSIEGLQYPKFVKPPQKLVEKFDNLALPMFKLIELYTEKNANLRRTRESPAPETHQRRTGRERAGYQDSRG